MKQIISYWLAVSVAVLGVVPAFAADPELAGTWQGKLQAAPNTAITIQFTFTRKPDGTYTATLNSPDNGAIKNVPAKSVSLGGSTLRVQVPALNGSYAGTIKGSSIEGQWTQPGGTLPLALNAYRKPQMTQADINTLLGSWNGPMRTPMGTITFVMRFKVDDKGELQGTLSIPEQGAEAPLSDIQFAGGNLNFKVPMGHADYSATYANATFSGTWSQGGPGQPLTLKRGDIAAPAVALKLSAESFAKLTGNWQGTLTIPRPQGQKVDLVMVMRFETDSQGRMVGYLDSPTEDKKGIPITDVSLTGSKLAARIGGVGGEYDAVLSGNSLAGQWKQGPAILPLSLTRK